MVTAKTKQSFKDSILKGEDEITVDNPELAKWVVLIHGIKQLAWSIAIVAVAAGLYTLLATAGASAPATAGLIASASAFVGFSGASAMVGLGLALGGATGLTTLRNKYKITQKGDGYVVLKRK
jgi:hypothetical protein